MTWAPGRDKIEEMLSAGHLERVPANEEEGVYLLAMARRHLGTSDQIRDSDPEIAYDALYAAARKALTALLRQQGLRPTRAGGHEAAIQAAEAQLNPPAAGILRPYRGLKRVRAAGDYEASQGAIQPEDVEADLPRARAIVDKVAEVLPHMPVFVPGRN